MNDPSPLEAIFFAALEKESLGERAAYLDEACAGDQELRRRVERMLAAQDQAGSFLEKPARSAVMTVDYPITEGPGSVIGPYKLLEQIGEGGFGVVFVAEQMQPVRRKVALKILKPGMDSRPIVARFEAERQALAIMDHPNIAKVHDGGATPSGRPYFVMELVKGVPITEFCDQKQLTPRQRLELFVSVCRAVQHAHQKGIIHRDLKPSNVLVAVHDTTPVVKVIDFGVAKAVGQELTDKTLYTGFAQMIGTPLYMSPEQAGQSGLDVDTRSDIYSLGVLLYELLTGTTPFTRERFQQATYEEIRRIIREEDPPRPSTRLSDSTDSLPSISALRQTDPAKLTRLVRGELDWIVMKALEKDRGKRYEAASAFAADVERYLHDEPVQACPPSAGYRLRKFARRHKAGLQIAAAAALVLLLAVGGVIWALLDRAARRTELSKRVAETEQTVNAALVQADQWRKQAGEATIATSQEADAILALWRQADGSLAQAEAALRTGTAGDRLRERVLEVRQQVGQQHKQARRRAKLLRDLDEARMARSIGIDNHFDYRGAATKFAAAFAAFGLEVSPGRTEELARRIRAEPPAIREILIVALDYWWDTAGRQTAAEQAKAADPRSLLRALADAADDDPWRRQNRAAATAGDVKALRALRGQAPRLALPPSSLELLALSLSSQGDRSEAVALLRWARVRHLTDFWIHFELGHQLQTGSDKSPVILEEAIGCYRTALALRPAAVCAHINLGVVLYDKNQLDDAVAEWNKAIDLDPKNSYPHTNIGMVLCNRNQLDAAITEFRKAIDLDPKFALGHNGLGTALYDRHQFDGAIAEFRKTVELDPELAVAHDNLANALAAKNQWDEAITEYHLAIELDPRSALAHNNLGIALHAKNQVQEAIAVYKKAIELDPKYAVPHNALGAILCDVKHDYDGAIIEFRRAIDLDPRFAMAHNNLGIALQAKNQVDAAIAEFKKAIDLEPNFPAPHNRLGAILCDVKHDYDGAIIEFRQAIELEPRNAPAHKNLGRTLQAQNRFDEAIAEFHKAIDIDPKYAKAHISLGDALMVKNQWDEAIAEYRKAIELHPTSAEAHYGLGNALGSRNQQDEAIAEFKKAIDLQPGFAEAHCNLASSLRLKGQFSASLEFYKRGHALGSKRKDWRYPSAQWVAGAERLVTLEAKLADVLAGKATAADNGERLGLLEVCQLTRRHLAAARLYTDAFTADPKLADDLKSSHRYNAACFAALAAAGQGPGADKLDGEEQSGLRQQVLAWLRADLEQWRKRLEGGASEDRQVMRATLEHWQRDTDLAAVREADALFKLTAQEKEAWRKLWADVAEVVKKTGNAKG